MKWLITADLQLTDNPRDSYRWKFFDTLVSMIKHYRAEMLFILGDLTEEKDHHGAYITNEIPSRLREITRLSVDVCILCGNHDFVDRENPFFRWLGMINNITWYNHPTEAQAADRELLFLPHTTNYEQDWKPFREKKYDYVFTHNTFAAARAGSFRLQGIPVEALPAARYVISGDVHTPQHVGPVVYVGSPYLCDFGDDYEPRVLILDTETNKLLSVHVPGPQKRLVQAASITTLTNMTARKGDILKVKLRIKAEDAARWPELVAEVRAWGAEQGALVYSVEPEIVGNVRPVLLERRGERSDAEYVQAFAAKKGLDRETENVGLGLVAGFGVGSRK